MPRGVKVNPTGPFLKWAGGKGRVLPYLTEIFPSRFGAYHEPFLGAGAVYFHLAAAGRIKKAHLSDLNADLIATFCAVRDARLELVTELETLRARHSEANYYAARERFNRRRLGPVKQAALLIYLNKTGYNGLYRVNSKGIYNVPFGRYVRPSVFDPVNLEMAAAALAPATIEARDYATVLDRARARDLVYFDPPYDPLSHSASFTAYASGGFGAAEQAELADVFRKLDGRGVYVILSNHDTPLVRELYGDYQDRMQRLQLRRLINSDAARRADSVDEVIVVGHALAALGERS